MNNSQIIASRIKELCEKRNISVNKAVIDSGAGNRIYYNMLSGSYPSIDKVEKLADYFNVSVDYLLGRTRSVTETNSHNTISGNNNIIGNGNSVGKTLSEHEAALIDIFKNLDVVKQAKLLTYASELEKEG